MVSIAKRTWNVFITSSICLGVFVSLPILIVLLFALRPVLFAVAAVALCVSLTWLLFGSLRTTLPRVWARLSIDTNHLRLPSGVMLDSRHAWVRLERSDQLVVGIDDLAQAMLGPVQELQLPSPGLHVRRGEPLYSLRCGRRRLSFPASVSGTVLACNEKLDLRPQLINDCPYGAGWIVRLRGDDVRDDCHRLLGGPSAGIWFEEEVEHIVDRLTPSVTAAAKTVDNPPMRQLYLKIDDAAWRRFATTVSTPDSRPTTSTSDDPDDHPKDEGSERE